MEMSDAGEMTRAMMGESTGDAPAPTQATVAGDYDAAYHPGNLESMVDDVFGESDEMEKKEDDAMRELIGNIISIKAKAKRLCI